MGTENGHLAGMKTFISRMPLVSQYRYSPILYYKFMQMSSECIIGNTVSGDFLAEMQATLEHVLPRECVNLLIFADVIRGHVIIHSRADRRHASLSHVITGSQEDYHILRLRVTGFMRENNSYIPPLSFKCLFF